jgi:hypothetical protein
LVRFEPGAAAPGSSSARQTSALGPKRTSLCGSLFDPSVQKIRQVHSQLRAFLFNGEFCDERKERTALTADKVSVEIAVLNHIAAHYRMSFCANRRKLKLE